MVDTIEAFYKDKITMLKERIENERFERKIAQQAQQEVSSFWIYSVVQALNRMKKEVTTKKKQELEKYLVLLK